VGLSVPLRAGVSCIWIAVATLLAARAHAVTFDGEISYTSDYILRGISETGGRGAGQIDLRLSTRDGSFAGAFASTLNRLWHHPYWGNSGWDYEVEGYLGHRFDFSPSWSTTLTGTSYTYLKGNTPFSDDYEELSLTTSYLDQWTLDVSVIPNAVRFYEGHRLGRYPAYVVSTSGLIPLVGRLALTVGAGYYAWESAGYGYGNVGLTFELKNWRLDAGYYVADNRAQELFPYGRAGSRFAGTVSWHF
jgi:uncharacterized protein (TIGR02001 family)